MKRWLRRIYLRLRWCYFGIPPFEVGYKPNGILTFKSQINEKQLRTLKAQWKMTLSGLNTYRTPIIEGTQSVFIRNIVEYIGNRFYKEQFEYVNNGFWKLKMEG